MRPYASFALFLFSILVVQVATAQTAGLGVSRSEITGKLNQLNVSMSYQESPLLDGTQRLMGSVGDNRVSMELIGNPLDLEQVTVVFSPSSNAAENLNALAAVAATLTLAAPRARDSMDWFTTALGSGQESVTRKLYDRRISLNNYASVLGMVLLTVEAL